MNRICSIGRFGCLVAEVAIAARNPLTKAAKNRVRRHAGGRHRP